MTDIEKLLAIEQIKQLKGKYFYYYDHKDWARWKAEVWASDGRLELSEIDKVISGVDEIVEFCAASAGNQISVHHGYTPILEILTGETATGIWAMEDILRFPEGETSRYGYSFLHGWGHYHETYVRGPSGWRIQSTRLTRLYVERS